MHTVLTLETFAVAINALLAGASLDQSIKQLPARHHIGVAAFSEYSKAADLRSGVAWYASLGIGSALLTLIVAGYGLAHSPGAAAVALWCAIVLTLAHSATTSQAAPTLFRQRRATGDADQLTMIFNRFVHWQTARMALQVLTLGAMVVALVISIYDR